MLRQRLRLRHSPTLHLGRVIVCLFALAVIFYGVMVMLLAFKVGGGSVNAISAYRDVYDFLADLKPGDVTPLRRAIAAGAGLLAFLICGYLALKQIPRPYLARQTLTLESVDRGETSIEPRALERLAEVSAMGHPAVTSAAGRYGTDELTVGVEVHRGRELDETLRDVQRRVAAALYSHDLPATRIDVTLTGFDRQQRRELR
ncbi:MAG: hypothetical protein M3Z33_05285 [Actinomycetota bacterium]|nr:hypothetical protein [Actinomycetota bacterium]